MYYCYYYLFFAIEGMESGSGIELSNMQSSSTASPSGNVSNKKANGSLNVSTG